MKPIAASETYRTILTSPDHVERILGSGSPSFTEAAEVLARARSVRLVGSGTSLHAALAARHLLSSAGVEASASGAFEFAAYPPPLGPTDAVVVLSHSGAKRYSREAASLAKRVGASVVAVTGQGAAFDLADAHIETVPQERSQAHTASYLGAIAALGRVALECAARAKRPKPGWADALGRTPALLRQVLEREPELKKAAGRAAASSAAFWFVGGGPAKATALEAALKVKEMARLGAEGLELEEALHGPIAAMNRGDWVTIFSAEGPSHGRAGELAKALSAIEARAWRIGATGASEGFPIDAPEELSPLSHGVAAQLFALHLAEARGSDPDTNRREDPAYDRAFTSFQG